MNVLYYNDQIKEELDGAKCYIEKAICCKSEHPEWASIYAKMSEAELDHASNLIKIFEDDYKKNATSDPIYSELHESILKMYTEFSANVKSMHAIYSSK